MAITSPACTEQCLQPWELDPVTREVRGVFLPAWALGQRCSRPSRQRLGKEPVAGSWLSDDSLSCSCPHIAGCSDWRNVLSEVTLSSGYFYYRQPSWFWELWRCSHFKRLHPLSHLFVPNKIFLEEKKDEKGFKYRIFVLREESAERPCEQFSVLPKCFGWRGCVFVLPTCQVIMLPTNVFIVGQHSIGSTSAVFRMAKAGPCLWLLISFDAGNAVLLWFLRRLTSCCSW